MLLPEQTNGQFTHAIDCLKEFLRGPTREYGHPVCRVVDLVSDIRNDPLHVPIETVAPGGAQRPGPGQSFEFAMKIRPRVGGASVLIRLRVQVDAHYPKRAGLRSHQPREMLLPCG